MINLKLYGVLKSLCGKIHVLNMPSCSIKDILSYLVANFSSTRKYLHNTSSDLLAIVVNSVSIPLDQLKTIRIFSNDEVKLLLVSRGSGKAAKTIIGVILIIVGAILSIYGQGWIAALGYGMLMVGGSLVAQGMTPVITPSNYDNQLKDAALKKSYGWGGNALNLTKSGNPVPLGYGTMRVGSQVISGGLRAENI